MRRSSTQFHLINSDSATPTGPRSVSPNSGLAGREGKNCKRSWRHPCLPSRARITDTHLWRCVSDKDVLANRGILNQEPPDFAPATAELPR